MKWAFKVLGAVGFGLGLMISTMYVPGLSVADSANWEVLGWGFIGFAIGGLIAAIVCRACSSSCDSKS